MITLTKIEIEVPENAMKFLEGFCKFTGANVKEIIESEISGLPDSLLGAWPLGVYYVSVDELKKRYGLD